MTREKLYRVAYDWMRSRKEATREDAEKTAPLCAEFAELIFGCYRQETEAYKKVAEDALKYAPPKPIIVMREKLL